MNQIPQSKSGKQEWIEQFGVFLHKRRMEILREMLWERPYSAALDIGCGEGLLIAMGMREAVGIDFRSGSGVTIFASAEHLPFRNDCFDLVFAGEIIEHLDHPLQALRDWTRVLARDGTMIMSTPNGLLVRTLWNPQHKNTYSPKDIVRSLEKLGMKVAKAKGTFTGLVSGRRLFRLIPSNRIKMRLLRFPVPLRLSYDVFIKAKKAGPWRA